LWNASLIMCGDMKEFGKFRGGSDFWDGRNWKSCGEQGWRGTVGREMGDIRSGRWMGV
jgi:hypothetical protein